jgi:hypothetical protein
LTLTLVITRTKPFADAPEPVVHELSGCLCGLHGAAPAVRGAVEFELHPYDELVRLYAGVAGDGSRDRRPGGVDAANDCDRHRRDRHEAVQVEPKGRGRSDAARQDTGYIPNAKGASIGQDDLDRVEPIARSEAARDAGDDAVEGHLEAVPQEDNRPLRATESLGPLSGGAGTRR